MRNFILICLVLLSWPAISANTETSPIEIRLKDYYSSIAKKEVSVAAAYYHPDSQKADRARKEIAEFTQQFDLTYKISDFREVGRVDGDIIISFKEETTFSVGSKKLNTFVAKVLMVWRKDKSEVYRIWDSLPLSPAKAENTGR